MRSVKKLKISFTSKSPHRISISKNRSNVSIVKKKFIFDGENITTETGGGDLEIPAILSVALRKRLFQVNHLLKVTPTYLASLVQGMVTLLIVIWLG